MKRSILKAGAVAFAAASVSTVLAATTASAAPAASADPAPPVAAYNGVCGKGYNVVNSAPIGSRGVVYLTYSSATGKNCAVTIRNTAGAPVFVRTWVGQSGGHGSPASDSGQYGTYAGPVYLAARGSCVDWGGEIDGVSVTTTATNCGTFARS
ncbi:spore-associated protein A [Streptomyces sp. NPDC050617]|uniref:spore-associated protein A n=1 Tax=Streptomyces sp. NPDC050617 TaxID=3154628 RepID=UPI00343EC0D2